MEEVSIINKSAPVPPSLPSCVVVEPTNRWVCTKGLICCEVTSVGWYLKHFKFRATNVSRNYFFVMTQVLLKHGSPADWNIEFGHAQHSRVHRTTTTSVYSSSFCFLTYVFQLGLETF